jgi:hypothetical protein
MRNRDRSVLPPLFVLLLGALAGPHPASAASFEEDLEFLQRHTKVVVLSDDQGQAQVAVAPEYQGRVMTSTAAGPDGPSFGWINREVISDGKWRPHINVFGGEDRFWLGPEGGQFSIFFPKGASFTLEDWQTPAPIDWGAWDLATRWSSAIKFTKLMRLKNYSGTRFDLRADRTVRLRPRCKIDDLVDCDLAQDVAAVGFESDNRITNTGEQEWKKATGLLSIWILGMFEPSRRTTVVIPFDPGPSPEEVPIVNDAYFGKVPPERLVVGEQHLFFSGDGRYRSKIGVGPRRARSWLGSYAAERKLLTLVHFNQPAGVEDYVNSMWELQDRPFAGDVVNSYNDGPPQPGAKPLGPFYELETSYPAAALAPQETLKHVHQTFHLSGPEASLDKVAKSVLGIGLQAIEKALTVGR